MQFLVQREIQLDFGGILLEHFFFKFVSKVKHCIDHILGMVGLTDVKLKKKGSASIGCLVNYVLSTFDFTHDLDYFSRSNYKIALFQDLLA